MDRVNRRPALQTEDGRHERPQGNEDSSAVVCGLGKKIIRFELIKKTYIHLRYQTATYGSLEYSALAALRRGRPGSASFQAARKSW